MCAAVLLVVAVVAWRRNPGRRKVVARYPLVLLACAAVAASQQIFQRPGPPVVAADWTYPSGHASIATAVAFTAVALCVTMLPAWRTVVIAVESIGVVLTLVSRVALGEHYVTDVLGAVAGVAGVGLLVLVVLRLTPGRPVPA
jgi:undecaprenyl-diphosphatase